MLELLACLRHDLARIAVSVRSVLEVGPALRLIVAVVFLFGGVIKGAFSKTCGTISSKGSSTATC